MILVDTSVWTAVFARVDALDLEALVPFDAVVTCPPVIQEVLQGFRDERAYRIARDAMFSLPCVDNPMPRDLAVEAAQLYRAARRGGLTVRSSVDCLIAASAVRHNLELLHRDRDFAALARVSPLREHRV